MPGGYREIEVGFYMPDFKTLRLTNEAINTGRISYGPMCKNLESKIAALHSAAYGVVSASGTDSLRAALHAMKIINGWQDGDEVITAATTFVATVNIILQVGLKPVLVDVIGDHWTMNPYELEAKITDRTKAIIPVNLLGQAAPLWNILDIAQEYDLRVIEDSCEAMFVKHHNRPVGSWGDIGCFSFYMAHLVTAGVGGIAITDDHELEDVMRSLLNHGRDSIYMSIDDDDGLVGGDLYEVVGRRFRFVNPGYSSRMTELQAAIALPQVDDWSWMLGKRNWVASALTERLSKHKKHLRLPYAMKDNEHSWMMYAIAVEDGNKWPLVQHLEDNGVQTRDLLPILNQPVYRGLFNAEEYPVSNWLLGAGFYIGCHQGMDADDVDYIGELVDYYYGG